MQRSSGDKKEKEASVEKVNPFNILPNDALLHVFSFLNKSDLPKTAQTDQRFARQISSNEMWQRRLKNEFDIAVSSTVDAKALYREVEILIEYSMASVAANVERHIYHHGSDDDKTSDPFYALFFDEDNVGKLSAVEAFWKRHLSVPDDLRRENLLRPCKKMLSIFLAGKISFTPVEWSAYMALGSQVNLGHDLEALSDDSAPFGACIAVRPIETGLQYRLVHQYSLINGVIPWSQLPADFSRNMDNILADKQRHLKAILQYTSAADQTMAYNAVCDDYYLEAGEKNSNQLNELGVLLKKEDFYKTSAVSFKISTHLRSSVSREEAVNAALLSEMLNNMAILGCDNMLELMLLQHPYIVNYPLYIFHGESMLATAIFDRRVSTVALLLKAGADVNYKPGRLCWIKRNESSIASSSINFDMTPLMHLINSLPFYLDKHRLDDFEHILDLLLRCGADVDLASFDPISDKISITPREVCRDMHSRLSTEQAREELIANGYQPDEHECFSRCMDKICNYVKNSIVEADDLTESASRHQRFCTALTFWKSKDSEHRSAASDQYEKKRFPKK